MVGTGSELGDENRVKILSALPARKRAGAGSELGDKTRVKILSASPARKRVETGSELGDDETRVRRTRRRRQRKRNLFYKKKKVGREYEGPHATSQMIRIYMSDELASFNKYCSRQKSVTLVTLNGSTQVGPSLLVVVVVVVGRGTALFNKNA